MRQDSLACANRVLMHLRQREKERAALTLPLRLQPPVARGAKGDAGKKMERRCRQESKRRRRLLQQQLGSSRPAAVSERIDRRIDRQSKDTHAHTETGTRGASSLPFLSHSSSSRDVFRVCFASTLSSLSLCLSFSRQESDSIRLLLSCESCCCCYCYYVCRCFQRNE